MKHLGYISCIILTSVMFLTFILVQDMKHTSEKLLLQKEYIELSDTNHKQHEQVIQSINMIKQRDIVIESLIKKYELLLKQFNGTASWATNNEKGNTTTDKGKKF